MSAFEITILGCSSATPTSTRNSTSQLLNISEKYFLIDCGEGTQMQLRKFKVKFSKINHIFISHLHGDHFFGLVGLLSSFHLLGRTNEMHVYGAAGLKDIIELQFKFSDTALKYPLVFHPTNPIEHEVLYEDNKIIIESFPLYHRIPCTGFVFREKKALLGVIKKKIEEYKIPIADIPKIKVGEDFITAEGVKVKNEELTHRPPDPRSYAFCSDTAYNEKIIPHIQGVNMLYHEATFMDNLRQRAKQTFHSTTVQAATIAQKAEVGQLILGHYSARYKDVEPLRTEAKTVFENTELAEDGKVIRIDQQFAR